MQERGPDPIREISVELCLTVPARLSSLLPYIPLLMKAVVLALQADDEQVIKLGEPLRLLSCATEHSLCS